MGTTSQTIPQLAESLQVGQPFNPYRHGICAPMPVGVMASPKLSPTEKLVYCHLRRRAGERGFCWPSRSDVSAHTGIAERQVSRVLRKLELNGLIRTTLRGSSYGGRSNEYEFLWHEILAQDCPPPVIDDKGPTVTNDKGTPVTDDKGPLSWMSTQVGKESSSVEKGKEELGKSVLDSVAAPPPASPPAERKTPSDKAPEIRPERPGDSEGSGIEFAYASPEDELKSILSQATGEPVPSHTFQTILHNLELRQIAVDVFVRKTKPHLLRKTASNPLAMAVHFSRQFARLDAVTAPPIAATVAPASAAYVCPTCKSPKPGEGSRFLDGQIVPCHCATPEYIAAKRHIFAAQTAIGATTPQHAVA